MKNKKIRGLKRRKKNISNWKEAYSYLDLNALEDSGKYYVKLWIEPWYNLFVDKSPPAGYRNEMTEGLVDIYKNWKKRLEEYKKNYYLKIWLFDPDFMSSQVVAAVNDNIEHYKTVFTKAAGMVKFPVNKFPGVSEALSPFRWEAFLDEVSFLESDFKNDKGYLQKLQKTADRKETVNTPEKDTIYFKTKGTIWVGEITS